MSSTQNRLAAVTLGTIATLGLAAGCTLTGLPGPLGPGPTTPTTPTTPAPVVTPATSVGRYDIGAPRLTDVWLDPVHGDDANTGADRAHALHTLGAAWARVPADLAAAPAGIRIQITPGTVPVHSLPNNWYEARHGTATQPIIIQAADGRGTVTIEGGINALDVTYLYLLDLRFTAGGPSPAVTDVVVHGELVDHLLLRNSDVVGDRGAAADMKEGVKINQSTHVYLEGNDISGGWDNPVDFVAVQYGHTIGNRIHDGGDWCMYTKGGSAYHVIDSNELYSCGTGGYVAGQGSGFEWMHAPFLTYEAMAIEFTNNIVHDVDGAGFGTNGGFNILFAHNTLYRVGARSHTVEIMPGNRVCDGDVSRCTANNAAGGWGPRDVGDDTGIIPNRHIFVTNNVIVNPTGGAAASQHFAIGTPLTPPPGWNIASPARFDDDLQIRGNVIWNGGHDTPLGIEDTDACPATNVTCNETELRRDNAINTVEPHLVDPSHGDYRLRAMTGVPTANIAPVAWSDAPNHTGLSTPAGVRTDATTRDRTGATRAAAPAPGAY